MTEPLDSQRRKLILREMLLSLHHGASPEEVKPALERHLKTIPYDEVVEVEQQLIREGLPVEELIQFCDIHSQVLRDTMNVLPDLGNPGHPLSIMQAENQAIKALVATIREKLNLLKDDVNDPMKLGPVLRDWQLLNDVDKHYRRKENLLFPFIEKAGIEAVPKVMWGKHDEIRKKLKDAYQALKDKNRDTPLIEDALNAVLDMVQKEEQIFLPLCQETLTPSDWAVVHSDSPDIGFCLIDPSQDRDAFQHSLSEEGPNAPQEQPSTPDLVRMSTGILTVEQIIAIFNLLPVDITFVDAQDKVRYFSKGHERIFDRNIAVLGRDVRMCHPPHSVHIVETILNDFREGRQDSAPFWIELNGRFIHIEYFAVRSADGTYLGCLEVTQDLTEKRALQGQQRLLQYRERRHERN